MPGRLRVEQRHGDTGAYAVAWEVGDATYRQLAGAQPDLADRPLDLTWYAVGVVVLVVLLSGAIPVARRRPFRFGTASMVVLVALAAGAVALLFAVAADRGSRAGTIPG